jgi:hypothetical protein
MAWATPADVLTYTGQTVTDAQVNQAASIVALYADVTDEATTDVSLRDSRLLKKAVVYQTAWMADPANLDYWSRSDVSQQAQDGASWTWTDKDSSALHVLARRHIERLSWKTARSIQIERGRGRLSWGQYSDAWLMDEEPGQCWKPLC